MLDNSNDGSVGATQGNDLNLRDLYINSQGKNGKKKCSNNSD